MNEYQTRDELKHHRLFSFVNLTGKLDVNEIHSIKKHVFRIETVDKKSLILKAHQNEKNVNQQWRFFEKINRTMPAMVVPFKKFPSGDQVIKSNHFIWTLSPFIFGRKLNYRHADDRKDVVKTLKRFHKRAAYLRIHPVVKKTLLLEKWIQRLKTFQKTKDLFEKNSFESLYFSIQSDSEYYLKKLTRMPWSFEEIQAMNEGVWIHGDVASHNFIKNEHIQLIDFDLLQSAPQIYDYIQLGQRFLPYIDWDLDQLLSYEMVSVQRLEKWLMGILMPSDMMREWLHFLMRPSHQSIPAYLKNMEKEWILRKKFSKSAQTMLESI